MSPRSEAARTASLPVTIEEHESCPATALLHRLGDKWTPIILSRLARHPHGFNELDRAVEGLSRRMLTRTLRTLEREGFLTRTPDPTPAGRIEYALTDLGRSLCEPMQAVATWAETHEPAMRAARSAYDTERTAP